MSGVALMLCGHAGLAAEPPPGATVIDELCDRPAAAADALRQAEATRAVLGLCHRRPSSELLAGFRRAGAEPFGVETVALADRPVEEATLLLAAAEAKLAALPAGERGRPTLSMGAVSRRTLLSPRGAVSHAPIAALDRGACAGSARCGLCIDECPAKAIGAGAGRPVIDANACTACGLCVPRCPQGALRITGASTGQVEAQLERLVGGFDGGFDGVVLACAAARADAPAGWACVELPTLALVSPGWLLQLRARGTAVVLAPCEGPCCSGVAAVEECADLVLEQIASPEGRQRGPIRLTEPAATATAVSALVPAGAAEPIVAEAAPLGLVDMDRERCTLCSACASACPTEALRFEETPDETVLRLSVADCVGCGRCVRACPEAAIAVEHGVDLESLARGSVDLAQASRERCRDCGADLPPAPMRRRLRELLPRYADTPLELCTGCAAKVSRTHASTD